MTSLNAVLVGGCSYLRNERAKTVPWWSFSKTVLAAAFYRLVEQNPMSLDDPVPGAAYSLDQLLHHTAGVPNYSDLRGYRLAVGAGQPAWTPETMLARLQPQGPAFAPGEGWAYSNTGYYLVRTWIEALSGLPLQQALRRLVFEPLRIRGPFIARTPADLAATAWGNTACYDPRWVYHGLLVGTPEAAVRTLHGILCGGLLPPWALAEMASPTPLHETLPGRGERGLGYGAGLMVAQDGTVGRILGHSGQGPGSSAAVYHYPDLSPPHTVAVFGNAADQGAAEQAALDIASGAA